MLYALQLDDDILLLAKKDEMGRAHDMNPTLNEFQALHRNTPEDFMKASGSSSHQGLSCSKVFLI